MALDAANRGAKIATRAQIELLAQLAQPIGRGGLEANEDARTPRLPGQRHQLVVVGEIDGGLGNPFLAQLGLGQGTKKLLGASDVVGPRADQIVVDHQNALLWNGGEFTNHVVDRALPVLGAVEDGHAAEAAIQGTATRRLDRAEGVALGQQILPRGHEVPYRHMATVVLALQLARLRVQKNLGPHGFPLLGHDRVHPLQNLLGAHGGVNAAHDDGYAEATEVRRDLVSPYRLRGECGDAHQIRARHGGIVEWPQVFVEDGHLPVRRRQTGQHQQAKRFPDAVAVPAVLLRGDAADQWIGRVDQIQAHRAPSLKGRTVRFEFLACACGFRMRVGQTAPYYLIHRLRSRQCHGIVIFVLPRRMTGM